MNCDGMSRAQIEAWNARQRECAAMELTFLQINFLPVTTECPPEELCDADS